MSHQIFSSAYSLVKEDLKKVAKGLLYALSGALVAFLTDITNVIDFSHYGPVWGPVLMLAVSSTASSFVNLITKWMTRTIYTKNNQG